jgi:hypothetical protein
MYWNRKYEMALFEILALEENMELSQDRLHNEWILAWSLCEFMETPKVAFTAKTLILQVCDTRYIWRKIYILVRVFCTYLLGFDFVT